MKKRIQTALILSISILMAIPCFAQSDGGKKKKKPVKTEQQTSTNTKRKQEKSRRQDTGSLNGHEWVNLGLSVKWATCNIGATNPSDYGNYYAWGETTTKSSYDEHNSRMNGKEESELLSAGIIDSSCNLTMPYDAARVNWGGTWRMPTKEEMEELKDKCTWTWTSQNGHNGYQITGPNGKSIFIPATGWCEGSLLDYTGDYGEYWSSSCYNSRIDTSYRLSFFSGRWEVEVDRYSRKFGYSIRPVSE